MSSTFPDAVTAAEQLRRSFAREWGAAGAAWGLAPSTGTVQGYLLVSAGPLTEPEVRRALDMSHRSASMALVQCEEWGLIQRADGPRRSGQRGPAAAAWSVVGDHWEWFRRVAAARKQRETDPVLPILERSSRDARTAAGTDPAEPELVALGERLDSLLRFVRSFDRGVEVFVSGHARAIEGLFAAMDRLEGTSVERLWRLLDELRPAEIAEALNSLAKLPPPAVRRLIGLADQPVLRRLLGVG